MTKKDLQDVRSKLQSALSYTKRIEAYNDDKLLPSAYLETQITPLRQSLEWALELFYQQKYKSKM